VVRGARVLLVAFVLLAGACSRTKTLDGTQLEQRIAADMQTNLHLEGVTVSCPDDIEVATGGTFTCTATDADGTTMTIQGTQTDDQGNVTYKVAGEG
jgi:Domain of unknown function (DUF4333)